MKKPKMKHSDPLLPSRVQKYEQIEADSQNMFHWMMLSGYIDWKCQYLTKLSRFCYY